MGSLVQAGLGNLLQLKARRKRKSGKDFGYSWIKKLGLALRRLDLGWGARLRSCAVKNKATQMKKNKRYGTTGLFQTLSLTQGWLQEVKCRRYSQFLAFSLGARRFLCAWLLSHLASPRQWVWGSVPVGAAGLGQKPRGTLRVGAGGGGRAHGGTKILGKALLMAAVIVDCCLLAASLAGLALAPRPALCCSRLLPCSLAEARQGPRSSEPEEQDFPCLSHYCLTGHSLPPCCVESFYGLPELGKKKQDAKYCMEHTYVNNSSLHIWNSDLTRHPVILSGNPRPRPSSPSSSHTPWWPLGWGSLLWDSQLLSLLGAWAAQGMLPSGDGVHLVIWVQGWQEKWECFLCLGTRVPLPSGKEYTPTHTLLQVINLVDSSALGLHNQLFFSLMDELLGLKDYSNHRRTV